MGGPEQNNITLDSQDAKYEIGNSFDSLDQSESNQVNLLDQAFILYSDEDVISMSSRSFSSVNSYSSHSQVFSASSCKSSYQNSRKSQRLNHNMLNSIASEQSSIYDVRESQCSESRIQLMQSLEPLFQERVFLRRSPRFHNEVTSSVNIKKEQPAKKQQTVEMIEDEKSQILQEKEEHFNANFLYTNGQKDLENSVQPFNQSCFRVTRSSKKLPNFESQTTYSGNSRQEIRCTNTSSLSNNEYVSKLTKQHILAAKKEKKIKKAQRQKSGTHHKSSKHYNLRCN